MATQRELVIDELRHLHQLTPEDLHQEQLVKLQRLVAFHYQRNPVYQGLMAVRGVTPEDIRSLDDLRLLPILDPKDITSYQDDLFSCPQDAVTFLHTSGSTGVPKIIPVTSAEKLRLARNDAVTARILGVREGNIYCTYPCGPWPSAFFAQHGAELIGPTIRADMGLPIEWHLPVLRRFRPRAIMASPSYISYFATQLRDRGVDLAQLGVSIIKLAGEPLGRSLRADIEEAFGARVADLYGSAELGAASTECSHLYGSGLHHYYATELIYEVHKIGVPGVRCEVGERGELVVTALFRHSIPIIRYRTHDIVSLADPAQRCDCGLGLPLASCILGRVDDMLTYGGANVYPEMFYTALSELGCDDKFQVALRRSPGQIMDQLVVRIEKDTTVAVQPHNLASQLQTSLRRLSSELDYLFRRELVNPIAVELCQRGRLYSGAAKLRRFVDEREMLTPESPTARYTLVR